MDPAGDKIALADEHPARGPARHSRREGGGKVQRSWERRQQPDQEWVPVESEKRWSRRFVRRMDWCRPISAEPVSQPVLRERRDQHRRLCGRTKGDEQRLEEPQRTVVSHGN